MTDVNFPTKEQVEQARKLLQEPNIGNVKINYDPHFEEARNKLINCLPTKDFYAPAIINQRDFALNNIYRIREWDSSINQNLIREFSYPPIDKTGLGRCNYPNYPVFYASDSPAVALSEVYKGSEDGNKKYFISVWQVKESDQNLFIDYAISNIAKNSIYREKADLHLSNIEKGLALTDKKDIEGIKEYLSFLHDVFISDSTYYYSAYLAHRIIYAPENAVNILIYPSVQTNRMGINFAINPNFVEQNMYMTRAYLVSIKNLDINENKCSLTTHKYAIVHKDMLIWSDVEDHDIKFTSIFKEDFKNYIID